MNNFKPCPFCGSGWEKLEILSTWDSDWESHVECAKCATHGPSSGAFDDKQEAISQAIEAWNDRKVQP